MSDMSDQGSGEMVKNGAQRAATAISETARTVRDTAADMADRTQDYAREAGRRASAAAQNLYGQGGDALATVERTITDYPLAAVLVAGLLGYSLACVLRRRA